MDELSIDSLGDILKYLSYSDIVSVLSINRKYHSLKSNYLIKNILANSKQLIRIFEKFDDGEYLGFIIETDKDHIEMKISSYMKCCEEISVDYFGCDKLPTFKRLNSFEIITRLIEIHDLVYMNKINSVCDNCIVMILHIENIDLYLVIQNNHNGYYCHNTVITQNSVVLLDTWL